MRIAFLILPILLLGAVSAAAEEAALPPEVALSKAKLTGGRVEGLDEALEKTREAVAHCVAVHGGLTGDSGRLDVQFLVRDRGRAEGVEVMRAQRVTGEAATCVQRLLKNRLIGTPSDDPVGVLYAYKFSKR